MDHILASQPQEIWEDSQAVDPFEIGHKPSVGLILEASEEAIPSGGQRPKARKGFDVYRIRSCYLFALPAS